MHGIRRFCGGESRSRRSSDDGQALPLAVIVMVVVLVLITGEGLVMTARFREARFERANAHLNDVADWAVSNIDHIATTSYDLDEVLKPGGKP